jgi:hypothetical protein
MNRNEYECCIYCQLRCLSLTHGVVPVGTLGSHFGQFNHKLQERCTPRALKMQIMDTLLIKTSKLIFPRNRRGNKIILNKTILKAKKNTRKCTIFTWKLNMFAGFSDCKIYLFIPGSVYQNYGKIIVIT